MYFWTIGRETLDDVGDRRQCFVVHLDCLGCVDGQFAVFGKDNCNRLALEGHFLIGPMAKLGWGTPTLISLSLGLILDIPRPMFAVVGVVMSIPSFTMKMFMAAPSATCPSLLSTIASSKPLSRASVAASAELTYEPQILPRGGIELSSTRRHDEMQTASARSVAM